VAERPVAGRRSFGVVVGLGVASAALAAVAGSQPWAHGRAPGGMGELSATVEAGKVPAANAAALVLLACWGVLLVSRGRVRRAVSALAVLAAAGLAVALVAGSHSAPDHVRDAYADLGVTNAAVERSGWYWAAAVAALLALATALVAVRLVPTWPEMGRRYDAPVAAAGGEEEAAGPAPREPENLDLWKAMDEGRDPTA